ncbi:MAG: AraC family transcriptional regulator [Muribaculaceae bacterium]|nr:AraC family transcriptional regulator [Muribaculaceae bacterium]
MKPIKYLREDERDALWGLTITTVRFEKIGPDEPLPKDCGYGDHSHRFSPERGRVLREYQLVYITEGSGVFESRSLGKINVSPGMIFLLFPDEWHTYQPDVTTGWTQYWIGFKGTNMDKRVLNGFFERATPMFEIGLNDELVGLFRRAIDVAQHKNAHHQQTLAGIVNYMLGLVYSLGKNDSWNHDDHIVDQINQARILMHENIESNMTVQDISAAVGVGYSSFRKNFKKYTGLSPMAYFQDLKIQRAKDLLRMTNLTIKEIAYRLNFDSPDYFSTKFRKKTGKRPSDFRS